MNYLIIMCVQTVLLNPYRYLGFRKGRGCQEYLSSITSTIETRWQANKSTFVAFVDFSKAYDRINRLSLWARLEGLGIPVKFLKVLQSLHQQL